MTEYWWFQRITHFKLHKRSRRTVLTGGLEHEHVVDDGEVSESVRVGSAAFVGSAERGLALAAADVQKRPKSQFTL